MGKTALQSGKVIGYYIQRENRKTALAEKLYYTQE
jgi:hypothetical protein